MVKKETSDEIGRTEDTGAGWSDNRILQPMEYMKQHEPYKYICRLAIKKKDGENEESFGTGFLVRHTQGTLVLTCGHNIQPRDQKTMVNRITLQFPGQPPIFVERKKMWFHGKGGVKKGPLTVDVGAIDIEMEGE